MEVSIARNKVIYLPTFGVIFSCNSRAQVDFELAFTVSIDMRDFLGNPWGQTSAGRSNNLLWTCTLGAGYTLADHVTSLQSCDRVQFNSICQTCQITQKVGCSHQGVNFLDARSDLQT